MTRNWQILDGDTLRKMIRSTGIVYFASRKSARERIPMVPADARYPGRKVKFTRGMATAVTRDGLRFKAETDHGFYRWINVSDCVFEHDPC